MNPAVILGAIGVAALVALGGKKDANAAPAGGGNPSAPKPSTSTGGYSASKPHAANELPPADVLNRMTAALATNDPKQIRAVAAQLKKEGWLYQAEQLNAAAATLEQAQAIVPILPAATAPQPGIPAGTVAIPSTVVLPPIPTVSSVPSVFNPASSAPSVTVPQVSSTATDAQGLAIDVQRMLTISKPGKEDKALVKRWQTAEGVKGPDGLYGPRAAKLAMKYGLVPVKPFYWSRTNSAAEKKDWKALMLSNAKKDPSRAAEWTAASRV